MSKIQQTISPVDGSLYASRPLADENEVEATLVQASRAQRAWRRTPLSERMRLCAALVDAFVARGQDVAAEITWQMGRPARDSPGEVRGFEERGRRMIELAEAGLSAVTVPEKPGFVRTIRREPLGVVLVLAPWNYPYLTSVNTVIPALLAGNAVILKHSSQTPLCAERYAEAATAAGLPDGLFSYLHVDHSDVARLIADARVDFVAFTGSVEGGRAVQRAASERFVATGLELGGKDPAYVRADADLDVAVASLVDGSFYNTGQSCCGIERIYVQREQYRRFVEAFVAHTRAYRLGDPTDPETTLGPMVRTAAADFVRAQIAQAVDAGARALVNEADFAHSRRGTPYLAPQVLVDVDHNMDVMREESFGPVVGIMPVADDDEAVARMNDSAFGLTASVWTSDLEAATALGERIETGTVFANRCDYLDPDLAWTGVKDSGRGCTLSVLGFGLLTRPKSYHFKK
ncbi:MAG: aldehyde dehydrogenase family protein [Myxococcales bacterium]|nr:aldehyde dehydrogenase family protein [Myxococcales bacterium]